MVLTYLDDFFTIHSFEWHYLGILRQFSEVIFLTDDVDIANYLRIDVVKCKVDC